MTRIIGELSLDDIGETLQGLPRLARLTTIRLRQSDQAVDDGRSFGDSPGIEIAREVGLDDPGRAAVNQHVMSFNTETRNIAAIVGSNGETHKRLCDDPGVPRAAELPILARARTVRADDYDVLELKSKHQIRIADPSLRLLEHAQLHRIRQYRGVQRSQEYRKFDGMEPVTSTDQVQSRIGVLQHAIIDVLLRFTYRNTLWHNVIRPRH
jgi:hypothetical protein